MSRGHVVACLAALFMGLAAVPVRGDGPTFRPDIHFQGSTLTGWHTLGDADWKAVNGEITGTPKQPGGGWLVLDRSFQDVGFFASVRCTAGCKTGVLLRAEKTADGGMKGIFVSLDTAVASYAVTVDAEGRETSRQPLRPGGGQMRIAPPPDPAAPARGGGGGRGGRGRAGGAPAVTLPTQRPDDSFHPGEWNAVELIIDANIVRAFLNVTGPQTAGGVADDDAGSFGPIALYVGATGEARFKDIAYKDLNVRTVVTDETSPRFRMQRLSDFYYSWGAGAEDFNHDGVLDVVSGPHIYFGPDYKTRREIYLQIATNPSDEYTRDAWMQHTGDFTGDGWADVIDCTFSPKPGSAPGCYLYTNPHNEPRRWDVHLVVPVFQTEIAVVTDIDADGKPELVYGGGGAMHYAEPDPANPTGTWIIHDVSEPGYATAHGVGAGDINGDKRIDIVNAFGWWEQPPAGSTTGPWTYHPEAFSRYGRNGVGGSVMAVYDANGDGLNDVMTVLNAHGFGLAWFEQKRDAAGKISFLQHMIMDDYGTENAGGVTFSEAHATGVGDMDADGIPDFIVAKRYWSHRDDFLDPDPYGPPVLYIYKTVRNPRAPGGAEFVPELVNNHSGGGSDVFAGDLNKDGRMDIVTATRFGTFIFWGQATAVR
jgi:hypothetical protein